MSSSTALSSDFKLLDFRYVNRAKYEYSDLEKVNPRLMVSNSYYAYDPTHKYLYYFETPRLRTLTEVYKVGDRFFMDLVVPLGSLFMEYLIAEDETNISATIDNSVEWFGSQIPPEIASEKYKSALILRSGGEDPIFRVNIPSYRGKPVLEVYDNMRRPIDISRIKPDMEVACICQKVGIRFSNTTFSGDYDCFKIKITQQQQSAPKIPTGYVFNDGGNGEPADEVDVKGYADRLMTSEDLRDDDGESLGSIGDEISETDSVLNDLEEVDFTDGESEYNSDAETGEEEAGDGDSGEEEADTIELTEEDLDGLEEVVVEQESDSCDEYNDDTVATNEIELTDADLEGLEEMVVGTESDEEDIESVNLESDGESELDDIGLEEVNIDGEVSVEEVTNEDQILNDIDANEFGLESLDLTPSKKNNPIKIQQQIHQQKHQQKQQQNKMVISELTDNFIDDI